MYCMFLSHSWSVHGAYMQSGLAPLMRASDEGLRETVEVLLADGADANVKDKVSQGEGVPVGGEEAMVWVSGLFATCERSNRLISL